MIADGHVIRGGRHVEPSQRAIIVHWEAFTIHVHDAEKVHGRAMLLLGSLLHDDVREREGERGHTRV